MNNLTIEDDRSREQCLDPIEEDDTIIFVVCVRILEVVKLLLLIDVVF
jgi:hypothetical protein